MKHGLLICGFSSHTSMPLPSYGDEKCGAGAAESAWQAEGAAAAAVLQGLGFRV